LEIAKLGKCKFFGDSDILADKPGGDKKVGEEAGESGKEPYSVVTASSCEIIYLSREAFCEFLSSGGKPPD
jgi:CRP-like cAMP-binding protein